MKIKKSDLNILIIFAGVAIAFCTWFFLYRSMVEKTAALNVANETLQAEVDYLQNLADHKQQYIDDTNAMQASIDEIQSHFPAEYRPEDDIMYIIGVENEQGAEIPSIGMSQASMIEVAIPELEAPSSSAPASDGAEEGEEAANDTTDVVTTDINLYRTTLAVSMKSTYQGLKDIVNKLNTDEYRKSIDSVSVTFDVETGLLGSTMAFSAYSLTGTDAEYQSPTIPGIFYGTNDIFNTGEKAAKIMAEKAAEEGAEEEAAEE